MAEVTVSPNNVRIRFRGQAAKEPAMPSVSASQSRLMAAAAHTPGGFGGVPQSVGKDFNKADTGSKRTSLPEHVVQAKKLHRRGVISKKQFDKIASSTGEKP